MTVEELSSLLEAVAPIIKDLLDRFLNTHFLEPELPMTENATVHVGIRQSLSRIVRFVETDEREVYQLFAPLFHALEEEAGGFARFLRGNAMQVPAEIAAAFNHVAAEHNPPFSPIMPDLVTPALVETPAALVKPAKKSKVAEHASEESPSQEG